MSHDTHAPTRRAAIDVAIPFVAALVALAAWAASMRFVFVTTLLAAIAYQTVVVIGHRGRRAFGVHLVGAIFLASLLAAVLGGSRAGVLLMPAGFAYLFVGLDLSHASAVREWAARALRGRRLPPEEAKSAWTRDRAALGLVIPTCLVAALLVPAATWTWRDVKARFDDTQSSADVADPSLGAPPFWDTQSRVVPRGTHGVEPPGTGEDDRLRIGSFEFGSPDAEAQQRVVCEVTPTSDGKTTSYLGAFYLRGMPLVDIDGQWREDFAYAWRVADGDDGRADGWCEISPRPSAADQMDLAVHQAAIQLASSGEAILLSPPGTTSVETAAVRAVPGGGIVTDLGRRTGALDFKLIARRPSRVPFPGPGTRFAVGDPRAAAAPTLHRGWDKLVVAAREATSMATSDVGRVQAVMERLRRDFIYEQVGGNLDDANALLAFVLQGRGTCLQFAEAGAVMLRSLGVPARVGRGFLVTEWDDEQGRYVVRARDGHAWIEVAFAGCGWVVFDPTPDAPKEGGPPRPHPEDFGPSADADSSAEGIGADGGIGEMPPAIEWSPLERALAETRRALGGIARWIADHPWACVLVVLAAIAVAARTMRRRSLRLAGERAPSPWRRTAWEHLLADLARRGHTRRPSQTATQFAASVLKSAGDAYAPFVELTARRQASRFGGRPADPADDADIERFRASL